MLTDRIQRSVVISAAGHVGVLAFAIVTFAVKPLSGPAESLPVEIVSSTELSQIMQGAKNAKQSPTPKPLVEKVADPAPATDDPATKISEKMEIKTAAAGEPPPLSEEKPQPKPPEKAEPKKPEPAIDPIAEAIKKEEAKKPVEKKVEAKPQPKKPEKQYKFDPKQMAALIDKHEPQRHAQTGSQINTTASLGMANARAATLSQTELDALREQIRACWNPPAGALEDPNLVVKVHMVLRQDGSLAVDPVTLNRGTGLFQITAESALRAIKRCQPFKLPMAKFEVWRDMEITFDPREMMRG